jgi:hypothetical protein
MKLKKIALTGCTAALMAVLASSADAATAVLKHEIVKFEKSGTTENKYSAEIYSFYNPGMGFSGWVHFSGWGYMKLTGGLPVTITAKAADAGFHPGIAVWRNAGSAPIEYVKSTGQGTMPYLPWGDIVEKSVEYTDSQATPPTTKKLGSLKMYFVANAVDRDGWEEPASYEAGSYYDNSLLSRVLDGEAGTVSLTFTPPKTGIYKFAVGGLNPAAALKPTNPTDSVFKDVTVTVAFPSK